MYIYQRPDWPAFRWSATTLATPLAAVRYRQGRLLGRLESLGLDLRGTVQLATLTDDAVKSSEIEGIALNPDQVRSSLAQRLGIDIDGLVRADRNTEGFTAMLVDATRNYAEPLTTERLCGWQAGLFEGATGTWRTDADGVMQVVSGPIGRERVHFEAPAARRLAAEMAEMAEFLVWVESDDADTDPVIRAAIGHLWLVTIHPFDDGNGRVARAVGDLMLARAEQCGQRFYSLSAQIRRERERYYEELEAAQRGDLDITEYLAWFLGCLDRAFDSAESTLANVMRIARFWARYAGVSFNERQRRVLYRVLSGFEGKLTSSKYAKLAKTSPDTALRDIVELVDRGVLLREGEGRGTAYALVTDPLEASLLSRNQRAQ